MKFYVIGGPGNTVTIELDGLHLAHEVNVLSTQAPMPAGISSSYLRAFSWVFSLGQCSEILKVTGRVHSVDERKELEDALRSWYYWSKPSLGTNLPEFHEDVNTYHKGLPGEILWSLEGGKSRELDYTFDFYVIDSVYTPTPLPGGFFGIDEVLLRVDHSGVYTELKWEDGSSLSDHLPANVTVLFLHVYNASSTQPFGCRRGDGTTDIKDNIEGNSQLWCQCAYDVTHGAYVWVNDALTEYIYLTGYGTDVAAVTFKEPVELIVNPDWLWHTVDITATCPGAVGVFMTLARFTVENFASVRPNGSSDDRNTTFILAYPTIACDSSQRIQCRNSNWFGGYMRFFITGYVKAHATWHVNARDIALPSAGIWLAINESHQPGIAFNEVGCNTVGQLVAMRMMGDSINIYKKASYGYQWAYPGLDSDGNSEVMVQFSTYPLFENGYGTHTL